MTQTLKVWPERGLLPPRDHSSPPHPNNYKSKKNAHGPQSPPLPKNAIIYAEKTQSKAAGGLSPSSSRW